MSRDISVWLAASQSDVEAALRAQGFGGDGLLSLEGRSWVLNASVDVAEAEDVPFEVTEQFRGAQSLCQLTLSPGTAPKAAMARQNALAKMLAKSLGGAVEDQQEDSVWVPPEHRLATRLKAVRGQTDELMDVLSLDWWFTTDRFNTTDAVLALVEGIGQALPEALPRRYGLWEPPQHKREVDGLRPYAEWLLSEGSVVSYTTPPVYGMSLHLSREVGLRKVGMSSRYWCHYLSITLDRAALAVPGYEAHLKQAFVQISRLLDPFYAEVRPLSGYIRKRGTVWHGRETESSPVSVGWWRGVPEVPCLARVVGVPYLDHWPAASGWEAEGALRVQIAEDWAGNAILGDVPAAIVQPPERQDGGLLMSQGRRAKVFPLL